MTIADIDCAALAYMLYYNPEQPYIAELHAEELKNHPIVDKYLKGIGKQFEGYLSSRPKENIVYN